MPLHALRAAGLWSGNDRIPRQVWDNLEENLSLFWRQGAVGRPKRDRISETHPHPMMQGKSMRDPHRHPHDPMCCRGWQNVLCPLWVRGWWAP